MRKRGQSLAERAKATRETEEQIISEYGDALSAKGLSDALVLDVSVLSHPKETILEALLNEMARQPNKVMVEYLGRGAMMLAQFQPGVGPKPPTVPTDKKMAQGTVDKDAFMDMVREFDADKIQHFSRIMSAETETIIQMVQSVTKQNYHIQPFYVRFWRRLRGICPRD